MKSCAIGKRKGHRVLISTHIHFQELINVCLFSFSENLCGLSYVSPNIETVIVIFTSAYVCIQLTLLQHPQSDSTGNTLHTRVYSTTALANDIWKEFNCVPAYVHIYIVRWNVIADSLQIIAL